MIRKLVIAALVTVASVAAPAATRTAAADDAPAPKPIKLGTLAPKNSEWGKFFSAWARAVKKETGGAYEIEWAYNGTAGDEAGMIGGMRSGALHGGALTATGLSSIFPSVIALQMPGLVDTWAQLDKVRNEARPGLDAAFEAAGFKILGWGDVGIGHVMFRDPPKDAGDPSKGFVKPEIRTPADLRAYNTFYVSGDAIGSKFLEALGVSSPRALSVPAILTAIGGREASSVDVITTPAIAAEQLQWAPHVTHVVDLPAGFGIGALVIQKKFLSDLPDNVRKIVEDTGKNTSELLTAAIRTKDDEAWKELLRTKTVVRLTDAEKAQWQAKFTDVRKVLKTEGKVKAEIHDAVTKAAGK
jgi:TRAP-type C4-dicarboxylate transport system substrate-binding protein